jgi:hypothetical protein
MRVNIAMRNQSGLLSNIGQFSKELFHRLCPQIVLLALARRVTKLKA